MSIEDPDILQFIRQPEKRIKGFELLVEKYKQPIYWLIRRMVVDHEDANDLTQETFIKAWRNLPSFRGDSAVYTWLFRIAVNESLGFLKKKSRQAVFRIGQENHLLEAVAHNEAFFRGDEAQMEFHKAYIKLPDRQRLVFNLKYFQGLSYQEISAITGTSEGALKASYHHAVMKIKKILTQK